MHLLESGAKQVHMLDIGVEGECSCRGRQLLKNGITAKKPVTAHV